MDGDRFDRLSRALSDQQSRRSAIRTLAASLIGGGAAIRLTDDAGALPVGPHRRTLCRPPFAGCTRHGQCCTGTCLTSRSLPRSQRNRCACDGGLTGCNGFCVDTQTDEANCGACGNVCASTEWCVSGACVCKPVCDGLACGDDSCGGSCGTCPDGQTCGDGVCLCGGNACADGEACCDGACIDTATHHDHCGGCGTVCAVDERCSGSTCVPVCQGLPRINQITYDYRIIRMGGGHQDDGPYDGSAPCYGDPTTCLGADIACSSDSTCEAGCPATVAGFRSYTEPESCGCIRYTCIFGTKYTHQSNVCWTFFTPYVPPA